MAIIRVDKAQATYSGNLVSFQVPVATTMTNGLVFNLGALVANERELHAIAAPAAGTLATAEVLINATPEVMYASADIALEDFVLTAGQTGRGFHMSVGDVFTVTDDLITGNPVVGEFVVAADAVWTLAAAAADPGNTRFLGQIIEETTLGFNQDQAWAFRVIKA